MSTNLVPVHLVIRIGNSRCNANRDSHGHPILGRRALHGGCIDTVLSEPCVHLGERRRVGSHKSCEFEPTVSALLDIDESTRPSY